MTRMSTLIISILLAWSAMLQAHGPTRQKVVVEMQIPASPDEVWQRIGNFQDMSWHPAVESLEGSGGSLAGATRTLTVKGGGVIDETLEKYDADKRSLFYRIVKVDVGVLPVTNYSSWLTVNPTTEGSMVIWKDAVYRGYPNNDPPPELNDQAAIEAVTGLYHAGLDNLKASFSKPAQ